MPKTVAIAEIIEREDGLTDFKIDGNLSLLVGYLMTRFCEVQKMTPEQFGEITPAIIKATCVLFDGE